MCCNSGEKGRTSTTGSQGLRFFFEELITSINDLCSPIYKDSMLLLHSQVSIILCTVSCQRKIKIDKFQELCNNATFNIITNMPWAPISHTLQGVLHHSADLITLNDGYGFGNLLEESLEANNKDIRNYLKLLSRKTSHLEQLTDVMSRLLERSYPCVLNQLSIRILQSYAKIVVQMSIQADLMSICFQNQRDILMICLKTLFMINYTVINIFYYFNFLSLNICCKFNS